MTPENKKIVKVVAISLGVALVLGSIVVVLYKYYHKDDDNEPSGDDTPEQKTVSYTKPKVTTYNNAGFTSSQVEKMQTWLLKIASLWKNDVIVRAIRDTGGIDGIMGDGFYTALKEAIRVEYVTDINDLYNKATTSTII